MATIIIMNEIAEAERRKREQEQVILFKKREENIAIKALHSQSDIHYGVMAYTEYHVQGQLLSNYKIHYTGNITNVINYIKKQLIHWLKAKVKINLLFYQTLVDPNLVSYHFITSSISPWLKLILKNNIDLCDFNGNHYLHTKLYKQLTFLKEYDEYKENLPTSKKQLKHVYYNMYQTKPIFLTKRQIYKKILKAKKITVLYDV